MGPGPILFQDMPLIEPRFTGSAKPWHQDDAVLPQRPPPVPDACSAAPEGDSRWTLRLLADRMVVLEQADSLWCIGEITGEYSARMEDILAVYERAENPRRPVVCFDERPCQLLEGKELPIREGAGG